MTPPVFAIVAHNDDWQLFMGRDMYRHIHDPRQRVVIVQITAGDAGKRDWYWKARQNGSIQAVIRATPGWSAVDLPTLVADHDDAVHEIREEAAGYFPGMLPGGYSVRYDVAAVNGRGLLRCEVAGSNAAATAMYFMHLPDGSPDGSGYASTGYQSLARLAEPGARAPVQARWSAPGEAAASYATWDDLIGTLEAIVRAELGESGDATPVWVHTTVSDATNPGDHSDHLLASRAVHELNDRRFGGALDLVRFYGYVTSTWEAADAGNEEQRALLYGYAAGFIATLGGIYGWKSIWDKERGWFGGREYWQDGGPTASIPPCTAPS